MKPRWKKALFWGVAVLLLIAMAWISTRPVPVLVDVGEVIKGPLVVTVSDDGRTRIKERYVTSSPISGRLSRIRLDEGAPVVAGETLIATIAPNDPDPLDARTRAQSEALVRTAKAAFQRAEAELQGAQSDEKFARNEWKRHRDMRNEGLISQALFEEMEYRLHTATSGLKAAEMSIQVARHELEQARAALSHTTASLEEGQMPEPFEIRSPITGAVLRVLQESSVVVTPGTQLLELGDPKDLEVIVDVLSSDAVKIQAGARVLLEHWGGEPALNGVVRLVEPSAFTKISALGVEEQRVWVVIDFTDPWEQRPNLGDGYQLEPRIVILEKPDVLKVPTGALFRHGGEWHTFVVTNQSVAERRSVEKGASNGFETEILSGLAEGEVIIVHPSEEIRHDALLSPRKS